MKKKMISFVSLGLVCITFFLSCEANDPDAEAQLTSSLEIPEKIISNEKAAALFNNDHRTRLANLGKSSTSFEAKAIHFELITLKNYIQHLENIAVSQNIPITGISFVFGANTDGTRTTFLMPSTQNARLNYQESFTLENNTLLTFRHIDTFMEVKPVSHNDQNMILSTNGYISFNEAAIMFNAYQTQYIDRIKVNVKRAYYTKAVWYSLAEIKSYLTFIQKQSNEYNLGITGIDVFFGVYDTNPDLELKSNAQTVFLAASTKNRTIINSKNEKLGDFITNEFMGKDGTYDENQYESLTFNEGQLSPPPKNN